LKEMDRMLPNKYYVKFFLGLSHLARNDPSKGLACLQEALELEPKDEDIPSIYSYMGVCLKDLGDYAAAIDVLQKGAELDPDRTDIYNLMGFCHFKLKQHEKAIKCFHHVIRLNPSSAIDYANIASNYRDMGDTINAMAYYRIALSMDPGIEFAKNGLEKLKQL
jgi:ribosomal protein S12 methylthiotransferase accessory factor